MKEIKLVAIDGVIHMSTAEFWKVQKDIRDNAIEECMDIVPFRIDDGAYSDGFNDCSKKVLDRLKELKEKK